MKNFEYKAISFDDKMVKGHIQEINKEKVIEHLELNKLIPVEVKECLGKDLQSNEFAIFKRKKHINLLEFTRSFSMLLSSGMPIEHSLKSMKESSSDGVEKDLVEKLIKGVREGKKFSDAMDKHHETFGNLYIQVVRAGEMAGRLDLAIEYLLGYLEEKSELRDNLSSMLVYPAILLVVTVVSFFILMVAVIPKFKELFDNMNGEIPGITQKMISLSDFFVEYGVYLPIVGIILLAVFNRLYHTNDYSIFIDKMLLKIKYIGRIIRELEMARFSDTLSMLMKNGMSIQKAIEISAGVITNKWIKWMITDSSKMIKEGRGYYASFNEYYPEITRQLIKSGEESSQLEDALSKSSAIIKNNINRSLKKYITILEPMIIVTLGVLIATIISSILVAIISMNDLVVI